MKIKRIFRFISRLIKVNKIKILLIIVDLLLLIPITNLDYDKKKQISVVSKFEYGVEHLYVVKEKDFDVLSYHEEIPIENGMISVSTDNVPLILSWFAFITILIILIIFSFIDDTDTNWEIEDNWIDCLNQDIICEFENEYYHYILDGRLLNKSKSPLFRFHNEIEEFVKNPKLFIEFNTVQQKRNSKLEKIFK